MDVGSPVQAGDVVSQLDSASAQIAVQQQEASLQAAQASLNKVLAGPKDDDVVTAQSQLDAAITKFNSLLSQGRSEDVRSALDQPPPHRPACKDCRTRVGPRASGRRRPT